MRVDLEQDAAASRAAGSGPSTMTGVLLHVDAPEWEAVLRTARHDFYHLPAYVALCAAQEHARPCALYVSADDRNMLLPLLIRDIPGGGSDATSPYGYPGPIGVGSDDGAFLRDALVGGLQVLREAGLVSAFVRFHPLLNPTIPAGIGTVVEHGQTVSVDLTLPHDAARWRQVRRDHRADITRALRLGWVARMDDTWLHWGTFRRLYRETMARRAAARRYFFDDAYFEGLRDALGHRLHLCIVEKEGVVAAAGLFAETDTIVQYHLSGTGEGFGDIQPAKLMLHFVESWAKDRGNRVLHLGGGVGGAADSLLQFKIGFSPLRHTFATLRAEIDEQEYGRLVAARDPYLDPAAQLGFFPLYRHED